MNEILKKKIEYLLSILNEQQKEEDILEITEKNSPEVYKYLETEQNLHIDYIIEYDEIRFPRETEGSLSLWHKELNDTWKVNLYNIHKMLNANWKK